MTPIFSTDRFSYKDKTFSAEISDLGALHPVRDGITLQNPKTGGQVTFEYYRTHRDREGDILEIWFKSSDAAHPDLKVILYND